MTRSDSDTAPHEGNDILSTREVARLIGVSEATVKRWADDSVLACFKTPGGHRKFRLSDVTEFRKNRGFFAANGDLEKGPAGIEELLRLGLEGDTVGMARVLTTALGRGESIEALCDEWLLPMLFQVGERWACGTLTVAQEHVVSGTVIETIGQLAPVVQTEPVNGTAIVGCLEGERHDLGSRIAGLVMRTKGYRVIQPGADTPVTSLTELAEKEHATLIVLSAAGIASAILRERALETLARWPELARTRVIVGGTGFDAISRLPPGVERAANMRDLTRVLTEARQPPP